MKITGTILSVNTAAEKGDKKRPVAEAIIKEGGVVGDAHFASAKEVSFLDWGSAEALIEKN
ncbi:MAG: hypothetical protein QME32_07960, partial [Endomicrobiia bacterium]|nr:hypothetical protein [Endomicrobiia bacterium]